ncbi:unnamed protein product [Pieris macdunnoughi]|uniref:Uncharacterized protein n=1 Tax=Pieris macdunnoughi TaxID=345717 RepID=A0A821PH88_9NEOP|nr:unnamed protein product [Pieris macdunnoughi]
MVGVTLTGSFGRMLVDAAKAYNNRIGTISIPLVGNEGKTGLGATPTPEPLGTLGPATMRLAAKTKMLQPPAKAFQNEPEDEFE